MTPRTIPRGDDRHGQRAPGHQHRQPRQGRRQAGSNAAGDRVPGQRAPRPGHSGSNAADRKLAAGSPATRPARSSIRKEKIMNTDTTRTPAVPGALNDPMRNRGAAFTAAQREAFGLTGRLPSAVLTLEEQAE